MDDVHSLHFLVSPGFFVFFFARKDSHQPDELPHVTWIEVYTQWNCTPKECTHGYLLILLCSLGILEDYHP